MCSWAFYSICNLCSANDKTNRSALQKLGLESMYVKKLLIERLRNNGFNVAVLNSVFAKSSPTSIGKLYIYS